MVRCAQRRLDLFFSKKNLTAVKLQINRQLHVTFYSLPNYQDQLTTVKQLKKQADIFVTHSSLPSIFSDSCQTVKSDFFPILHSVTKLSKKDYYQNNNSMKVIRFNKVTLTAVKL